MLLVTFYAPGKCQETSVFLIISGGIERLDCNSINYALRQKDLASPPIKKAILVKIYFL